VSPAVDIFLAQISPIAPNAVSNYYPIGGARVDDFNAQVVAVAAAINTLQSLVAF